MIPYFQEPPATERRPPFSAVPANVVAAIEETLSSAIRNAVILTGGLLPTATFRLDLADGRRIFAKGAQPADVSHATQNIRQEAAAYDFLKQAAPGLAPHFHGLAGDGDEDGWLLGLWDFIDAAKTPVPEKCFSLLARAQAIAPVPGKLPEARRTPYLKEFFNTEKKWRRLLEPEPRAKFTGLFVDAADADAWLHKNLPRLLAWQDGIADHAGSCGVMHGDARADNFIAGTQGAFVIDWANASLGPFGFDALFLTLDLCARTGADFSKLWDLARTQGVKGPDGGDLLPQLACFAGYFASQAYRPAPDGLPRLRWMQKALLRAALLALEKQGDLTPPPVFQR